MEGKSSESVARFLGKGEEEEDLEILKTRISCHPLYRLLIETHLDCLKVGMDGIGDASRNAFNKAKNMPKTRQPSSDLDHFMESYCIALSELKEAMEEPIQEATAFVNGMYFQLKELIGTHPTDTTLTTSSCNLGASVGHVIDDFIKFDINEECNVWDDSLSQNGERLK